MARKLAFCIFEGNFLKRFINKVLENSMQIEVKFSYVFCHNIKTLQQGAYEFGKIFKLYIFFELWSRFFYSKNRVIWRSYTGGAKFGKSRMGTLLEKKEINNI